MANPAITSVKSFTYRGNPEEWSNTYDFASVPANDAAWANIVAGIFAIEKEVVPAGTTFIRMIGYDNGDGHHSPTYHEDMSASPGVYTLTGVQGPGDAASWVRWGTGRLSSRGKPVYLRKYLHAVDLVDAGPEDTFTTEYHDALQTYLENLATGFTGFDLAGPTYTIADPMSGSLVAPFVTTRTLKRRGRRPT